MISDKRVAVIMPAYNAELTLERTYAEIPHDVVDDTILVDDASSDSTVEVAHRLGIDTVLHRENRGYGANQKTCYARAVERGADIVVMVHPDYQYTPKLIRSMAGLIAEDVFDVVLGSRILGKGARAGGMPIYKYVANRALTLAENLLISQKLSEYHTGYRAFSRDVLLRLKLEQNSDDFVFDNQMLVQCHAAGYRIGEITCPTRYFDEASSINFRRSVRYGFGCLGTASRYFLHRTGVRADDVFEPRAPEAVSAAEPGIPPPR